jgi:hypothetical protein
MEQKTWRREIEDLKETGLKLDFKAELVPWNKSGIDKLIENRIKQPIRKAVKERDKGKKIKRAEIIESLRILLYAKSFKNVVNSGQESVTH